MEAISFSENEYENYLQDPKWTKEETVFLLELCHRFDLRYIFMYVHVYIHTFRSVSE